MKIYHYPKCSTCKKALKFLRDNNVEFEDADISLQPPTAEQLKTMLAAYQGDIKKLFNTSGLQYRELKLKDKISGMTDTQAITLLAGNGMLIKRPFLIGDADTHLVGFKPTEWEALV